MSSTDRRSPDRSLTDDAIASGALAVYSTAVAAGFARVFVGWEFLDELIPIVLVGHGLGLLTRRLGMRAWLALALTTLVMVWLLGVLYYADTYSWGLPTGETWDVMRLELTNVGDQFEVAVSPVFYGGGWDALAAAGLTIAVVLADAFAFRAFARAEALVPGGVLFVFVGALGSDRSRVGLTVALVAAGVLATVVLRWYHAGNRPTPVRLALSRAAPAAGAAIVVVALGAGIVGPRLPGSTADAVYDTHSGTGGSATLVSPLVDIRSRLTNRSPAELFRVNADVESYWRSTTLPEFDGTIWTLPDQQLQSTDDLLGDPVGGRPNRQRVTIVGLEGTLVPAAPEPYETSGPDALRWVPATSTLILVDGELAPGDTIDIVSSTPDLSSEILEAATSDDPGNSIYTALPDDLPSVVATTARQVTAGARTPFEAARLLQAWFQREFEYSLQVQPGHGNDAVESFLRERVGYCEQFAGTYAAMLRTLDIPTRVAVGFTSGEKIGERVYSVRGSNAHAWPEVWFDGIGWVAFEPTPGRGAPNAEAYTGLEPQQAAAPTGDDGDDEAATDDDDAAPPVSDPGLGNRPQLEDPALPDGGVVTPAVPVETGGRSLMPWLVVAAVVLLATLPWITRRVRRRRRAATPEAQLARLWRRTLDAVAEAGVSVAPSDTPLEAASATATALPIAARPFGQLASVVDEAMYAPDGMERLNTFGVHGSSPLRRCHAWARQVEAAVNETASLGHRIRRYFTVWS